MTGQLRKKRCRTGKEPSDSQLAVVAVGGQWPQLCVSTSAADQLFLFAPPSFSRSILPSGSSRSCDEFERVDASPSPSSCFPISCVFWFSHVPSSQICSLRTLCHARRSWHRRVCGVWRPCELTQYRKLRQLEAKGERRKPFQTTLRQK